MWWLTAPFVIVAASLVWKVRRPDHVFESELGRHEEFVKGKPIVWGLLVGAGVLSATITIVWGIFDLVQVWL